MIQLLLIKVLTDDQYKDHILIDGENITLFSNYLIRPTFIKCSLYAPLH